MLCLSNVPHEPLKWGTLIIHVWRQGVCEKSLHSLLSYAVNLKLLLKIKFINYKKKKKKSKPREEKGQVSLWFIAEWLMRWVMLDQTRWLCDLVVSLNPSIPSPSPSPWPCFQPHGALLWFPFSQTTTVRKSTQPGERAMEELSARALITTGPAYSVLVLSGPTLTLGVTVFTGLSHTH